MLACVLALVLAKDCDSQRMKCKEQNCEREDLDIQAPEKTLFASLVVNQPNSDPSIANTVNRIQSSIVQRSIASDLRPNV
jgi:hypothetical protein